MTTHSNTEAKQVDRLLGDINELHAKKSLLLEELNRSMALQKFWPGIFKNGRVTQRIIGNACRPKEMKFIVTDGVGQEFECPLLEAPEELWAHLKPKFRAHVAKTGKTVRVWGGY